MAIKKCTVCGKEYEGCSKCERINSWKFYTDTVEHFAVHITLMDYRGGVINKKTAIARLAEVGVRSDADLSFLLPEVERDVRAIIGGKKGN